MEIFWHMFNQAYKVVNDTEKQFSPTDSCTDMASSNFTGIAVVYSNDI